jgi:hypothetical protein
MIECPYCFEEHVESYTCNAKYYWQNPDEAAPKSVTPPVTRPIQSVTPVTEGVTPVTPVTPPVTLCGNAARQARWRARQKAASP